MLRNIKILFLAIILTVALWLTASALETNIITLQDVPLEVKNIDENLAAALDPYEVDLKVIASESVDLGDFRATIDIANRGKGTYTLRPEINFKGNIQIFEITPIDVLVRVEDREEKEVEIKGNYEGSPAVGFIVGDIKISPKKAKAIGPKSEIERLNKAYTQIDATDKAANFEVEAPLVAFKSSGEIIRSIIFDPPSVKAEVVVLAGSNTKAVGVRPKITGSVKSGYWVPRISVNPSVIVVNGSGANFSRLEFISTKEVDISEISEDKEEEVDLVFPEGVISVNGVSRVKVKIEVSNIDSTRQVIGSLDLKFVPSNLRVEKVEPDEIKVVISGPSMILAGVTSEDVVIEIDLSGYQKGRHKVEIEKGDIKTPEGVGVTGFLPSAIEVTLQ